MVKVGKVGRPDRPLFSLSHCDLSHLLGRSGAQTIQGYRSRPFWIHLSVSLCLSLFVPDLLCLNSFYKALFIPIMMLYFALLSPFLQ